MLAPIALDVNLMEISMLKANFKRFCLFSTILACLFIFSALPAAASSVYQDANTSNLPFWRLPDKAYVNPENGTVEYWYSQAEVSGSSQETGVSSQEEVSYTASASVYTEDVSASFDLDYRFKLSTIGDSLTHNTHLQAVLSDRLNSPNYAFRSIPARTSIANHAQDGQGTAGILNAVISGNWGAGEGASFVTIMAGTNDIDHGVDVTVMRDNVQAMIDSLLGSDYTQGVRPSIIVAAMPPYENTEQSARAKEYNDLLRTTLDKVDIFTDATFYDLYNESTGGAVQDFMQDNKHPNDDGAYRLAEDWFKAIDALYDPTRIETDPHIYKMNWYYQRY